MGFLAEKDIQTKALVVETPGAPFVLKDVILDEIQPSELLVDIKYAGLCHTDLVVQEGKMPIGSYPVIPGHEGAGVILKLGTGLQESGLKVGDRVILSYCSCLNCSACKAGRKGACENIAFINFGGSRGGGESESAARLPNGQAIRGDFFGQSSFRKFATVDARAVVKYDGPVENLSFLAPMGCGYMTGAATVMNVLKPKPTSSVAIFGLGAVGLSALMAAKSENVQDIIAIDILESRLEMAAAMGATKTINAKGAEPVEGVIREAFPSGVNFVIDTTGSAKVISSGIALLAHGGTAAVVGTPRPGDLIEVEALDMLIHCKTVLGITGGYCDPQKFIPGLIRLFEDGSFPIDKLCKTYPPSEIDHAIKDMKSGKVVKPVLAW
ncbi:Benzyl alcohol dehydrogenase [Hyphodiscus hymeniophilus]|uniref:Benzyl alcohol dehydrogenase n=1 Tax=Hyphodiscus hymeniophilus TaxID=353542 RepID=A0A9P6VDW0_9HELO|nr:Benzyl alcohol dehydrogenase [Hyphodiscus hymeniophilus]